MSGVVLRCPNCGTIQPAEGQCDACHEAAVRFFCTNHTPGRWLDGVACLRCGARFGDPAPINPAPTPSAAPRVAPPEVGVPPTRPPAEPEDSGLWGPGRPAELESGGPGRTGADPFRILLSAMMSAARVRSAAAERPDYEGPLRVRPRDGCCLGRLLVLALLLFAFAVLAPVIFGMFFGFY